MIRAHGGRLLGAVGVSGDLSDRDEACAIAGIHAAGLLADPSAAAI
nr:heme-binding protein [Methylogaea oryzae]